MKRIEFFRHSISEQDIARAHKVMKSVFLTTGTEVGEFEERFSRYIRLPYTIGFTSCTAALHLCLLALGIKPGEEVITTPMSFCATANAVLHAGARPVFVDVEEETGNLNADLIQAVVSEKTRAILPVHLYGQMCDMHKIKTIAEQFQGLVIEDAAHAIESERDGAKVGSFADAVCFSFYATKNITSGEGGAASTRDKGLAEMLKVLRLHGIDKGAVERYTHRYRHWDMPVLGWKYNMDNIQAALLIGQLERIDALWEKRNRLWEMYEQEFQGLRGTRILSTLPGGRHARHLFTLLVDSDRRDQMLWQMQEKGVGVAVNYRPIHLLKYYRETFGYREGSFPVAEEIGARTISLPLYPSLSEADARYVIQTVKEILH